LPFATLSSHSRSPNERSGALPHSRPNEFHSTPLACPELRRAPPCPDKGRAHPRKPLVRCRRCRFQPPLPLFVPLPSGRRLAGSFLLAVTRRPQHLQLAISPITSSRPKPRLGLPTAKRWRAAQWRDLSSHSVRLASCAQFASHSNSRDQLFGLVGHGFSRDIKNRPDASIPLALPDPRKPLVRCRRCRPRTSPSLFGPPASCRPLSSTGNPACATVRNNLNARTQAASRSRRLLLLVFVPPASRRLFSLSRCASPHTLRLAATLMSSRPKPRVFAFPPRSCGARRSGGTSLRLSCRWHPARSLRPGSNSRDRLF